MNIGVAITAIVMLLIMCCPIFIFRNKGKKKDQEEQKDEQKENKTEYSVVVSRRGVLLRCFFCTETI